MQPDNIRPAARIPKITFSDDMFSSNRKSLRSQQQRCAPNATNLINRIIVENRH